VSDWTDTLDARRAGYVEGFHGAGERIDKLPEEQLPTVGTDAPDSDAPQPPTTPVEADSGRHHIPADAAGTARVNKAAAPKTAAKKSAAKKTAAKRPAGRVIK
jgi:hypothetical protein